MSKEVEAAVRQLLDEAESEIDNESACVHALNKIGALANKDRLACATAGALPRLSSLYQQADVGSATERNAMAALNALLLKDGTLSHFVGALIAHIMEPEVAPSQQAAAMGALAILNHKVYHPNAETQLAVAGCLPRLVTLLKHVHVDLRVQVARLIGTLGEATDDNIRLATALSGALPLLASLYQVSPEGTELEVAALSALYKIVRFHRIEPARQRLLQGTILQLRRAVSQERNGNPSAVRALRVISESSDTESSGAGASRPPTARSEAEHTPPPRSGAMVDVFPSDGSNRPLFANTNVRDSGALSCGSRPLSIMDATLQHVLGAMAVFNQAVYGADEMVHAAFSGGLPVLLQCLTDVRVNVVAMALRVLEGFADGDERVHFAILQEGVMSAVEDLPAVTATHTLSNADQAQLAEVCSATADRLLRNISDDRREALFGLVLDVWTTRCSEATLYHVSRCVHELATRSTVVWDYVRPAFGDILTALREGGEWGLKAALHMLHCLCSLDVTARHKAVSLGCCARLVAMLIGPDADEETRALAAAGLAALACGRAGAETTAEHASAIVAMLHDAPASSALERGLVNTLGNMATYCSRTGKAQLVHCGAGTELVTIMESSDASRNATVAAMALSNLLDVEDSFHNQTTTTEKLIRTIVQTVSATAAGQHVDSMAFEPWAPTLCLMRLSTHDENKPRLIKAGVLVTLQQLVHSTDTKTQELALRTLWNLAFTQNVERYAPGMCRQLRDVSHSCHDATVRRTCRAAIFQIQQQNMTTVDRKERTATAHQRVALRKQFSVELSEGGAEPPLEGLTEPASGHIMISYDWPEHRLALAIAEHLQLAGYEVWIDIKETPGGTLESLTRAVERAAAVVICHSATYQRSEFCRTQAEYAHRLLKPLFCLEAEAGDVMAPWFLHTTGDPAQWVTVDPRHESSWPAACNALQAQLGELGRITLCEGTTATTTAAGTLEASEGGEVRLRVAEQRAARSERRLRTLQHRVVQAAGPGGRGIRACGETPELSDDDNAAPEERRYNNFLHRESTDYSYAWDVEYVEPADNMRCLDLPLNPAGRGRKGKDAAAQQRAVDDSSRAQDGRRSDAKRLATGAALLLSDSGENSGWPRPRGNAMSMRSNTTVPTVAHVGESLRRRSSGSSSALYSRANTAALQCDVPSDTVNELVKMVHTLTAKVDALLEAEQRTRKLDCCIVM